MVPCGCPPVTRRPSLGGLGFGTAAPHLRPLPQEDVMQKARDYGALAAGALGHQLMPGPHVSLIVGSAPTPQFDLGML